MVKIFFKPERDKSAKRRHPWVYSGSIARLSGEPALGETVEAVASSGEFLGYGAFSPHSQIRIRLWNFDPAQPIDRAFFRQRLEQALQLRRSIFSNQTPDACRLVNAESDGLPGLIIDRYENYLVGQFLSSGAEFHKDTIIDALHELIPCRGIYERSDSDARQKEGLKRSSGLLWGEEPPELIDIREGPFRFWVDIRSGHKTGFYLDQRDNRSMIARFAANREVLNCFAYSGGFGIAALHGGASRVTNVDSSRAILDLAAKNFQRNGFTSDQAEFIDADVFRLLREFGQAGRRFKLIVLDPPKFAESASQVQRAARGYKDINRLAFELLDPGGVLFTFSCSGALEQGLFQKIVADAALDARRNAKILFWLTQAADHTVNLNFPEGSYLKGLVVRAD
jgi:23S rRNA (cytosine1962-C5)-methyltransferase